MKPTPEHPSKRRNLAQWRKNRLLRLYKKKRQTTLQKLRIEQLERTTP